MKIHKYTVVALLTAAGIFAGVLGAQAQDDGKKKKKRVSSVRLTIIIFC